MKVRADIAALIRAGHSDASIAHRLRCSRSTVWEARCALRLPPSRILGRFYAEAVPTGEVRDYRPERMPTSPAQQAANRERLMAALREAA
ncbi:helix-turn-helix domain-containing protein [Streptomyces lavendofoliae]|uniref:Uncharacterized protein n=1 Tax=Streptomyces lavendofoliae TaxID=67314 RepID=A0A918I117_9ACTN|nr:helix-turn-helix domain-containing protein [Streptomyces lavendofoliae]GGU52289.1 hypothetical protein GCM10010274_46500 [Streptomyces lavendofoliae]